MRRLERARPSPSATTARGLAHVVEIVERLAHAHQHDVGDLAVGLPAQAAVLRRCRTRPVADAVARQQHLADDLRRLEVAHQALRAGVAERQVSVQPTWLEMHRCRGRPRGCRRPRSRGLPVTADGQPQQPLARAVDRHLLGETSGRQTIGLRQRGAQLLGDVRHVLERRRAAHVHPAPQLADPHLELLIGHADASQRRAQALAAEAGQGWLAGERRLRGW